MACSSFGIEYAIRTTGRTYAAVYAVLHKHFGSGITRGMSSLRQAAENTGYTERQLQRAGRALGQRHQRTSRRGKFMLSDEQIEAMGIWLKTDYWCSRARLYACVWCGRADRPAFGVGLCRPCWQGMARLWHQAGARFGLTTLLQQVQTLREEAPQDDRDWLDAFHATLAERGSVLSRGTLVRMLYALRERNGLSESPNFGSLGSEFDQGWAG